ncbi:MAG: hypothetical protein EZS28_002990 [Streblomastix strix]|uniref:Polysaccharide biosynthesis domain-containing protein n=1 Tax=Streblomastix strix TaxID=222440 RepID=A0A5J4X2B7_9EUKA|nr:MAG: hypothetical protein EZS28_002990 [Streblomastix strix]
MSSHVVVAAKPTPEEQNTLDNTSIRNNADIEKQWAIQAFKYADVYQRLLESMDPAKLRLSKIDDEIYSKFRSSFPDLDVNIIDENKMKSEEEKNKWRPLLLEFKEKTKDWDFGTLLRIDASKGVSEQNTTLVTRIQFLCIEIARNKEGVNKKQQS